MSQSLSDKIPQIISRHTAEEFIETHVAKIYKYGDFALKQLVPASFIDADTHDKRRAMLVDEHDTGIIYNLGDPHKVYHGLILAKLDSGETETFLVMSWLPIDARLDRFLKKDPSRSVIEAVVEQMDEAHSQIKTSGLEKNSHLKENFIIKYRGNVDLAKDEVQKAPNKELERLIDEFADLQLSCFETLPPELFVKRLADKKVKFSHGDTKCENIYFYRNTPTFLDAVTLKQIWKCSDSLEELASFTTSLHDVCGSTLPSVALETYAKLNHNLSTADVRYFWFLAANWAFVRGWVTMQHSQIEHNKSSHDKFSAAAEKLFRTTIEFAKMSQKASPNFEF